MAPKSTSSIPDKSPASATAAKATELKPPEEQFWQRYSPHQEAPISTVTSIMLHVLGIGLLVGMIFILNALVRKKDEPLPVNMVEIGGGGGSPDGMANNRSGVGAAGDETEPTNPDDPQEDIKPPTTPQEKLPARADLLKRDDNTPEPSDDSLQRLVHEGGEAVDRIAHLKRDTYNALRKGLAAGKGQGGPGRDGGKDTGVGTGSGSGEGPGSGKIANKREKRVLRWTMLFNTRDGSDYVNQLAGLRAILAIPKAGESGSYIVFRDLTHLPVQGRVEELAEIKRIYWIDDKPESVHSLSKNLGLSPEPSEIIAFFPEELEKKLLELELNYRGRKEEEIVETRFEILRMGGRYEPHVISQR